MPPETDRGPFDGVLVIAFGGPQGPGDIRPFLSNVLRGRRISPARLEEVVRHYEHFGGVSPLNEITFRQARGLETRLASRGYPLPVYVGMRNWHPLLADTLRTMSRDGVRRAIGFICAAHRSYSSCAQYRQNVVDARAQVVQGGDTDVCITYVCDWHTRPNFIDANARHARVARERLPTSLRDNARLVFTAHSVPVAMTGAARYRQQIQESAGLVAKALDSQDWTVAFQSRSGRPEDPWLGPDVNDYLRTAAAEGLRAAVLIPIGFLCDHVEILYDLDCEAAQVAREVGLEMVRAKALNDDEQFLEMMADSVLDTWNLYRTGRPLPIAPIAPPERIEGPPPAREAS